MTEVIKVWKERIFRFLGAFVFIFGGAQFASTMNPTCYPVIEVGLNILTGIGLTIAAIAAVKKSVLLFAIFPATLLIKLTVYILIIHHLMLDLDDWDWEWLSPDVKDLIREFSLFTNQDSPEVQEYFLLETKRMSSRLYIAVYLILAALVTSFFVFCLTFCWEGCRLVRYGRRGIRVKENRIHSVVTPIPFTEVNPSAPFLDA